MIFLCENQEKPEGGLSLPRNNQNTNQFVCLSFGVDPLTWQTVIEIGGIKCRTTAWCSCSLLLVLEACAFICRCPRAFEERFGIPGEWFWLKNDRTVVDVNQPV